ncbi:MAG: hypothetical protein ACSLE0_22215 [Chitinophagaceae bacterium]
MANSALKIGVDIGGTRTKSGLVNTGKGAVLHQIVQHTEKINAEVFLQQMKKVITKCRCVAETVGQTITGIMDGIFSIGFSDKPACSKKNYGN